MLFAGEMRLLRAVLASCGEMRLLRAVLAPIAAISVYTLIFLQRADIPVLSVSVRFRANTPRSPTASAEGAPSVVWKTEEPALSRRLSPASTPPPRNASAVARCLPPDLRKIIVTGSGMLREVRDHNAKWTSAHDVYVERLQDVVPFGVSFVPATEFEPSFPAREESAWREGARRTYEVGSRHWGLHESDQGKPADGKALYERRFGNPEPPPGLAIFEEVLVNDSGDVKVLEGPCACCLFFIKDCFSLVGSNALQQRDFVASQHDMTVHAEVISVACRYFGFYHIVMDSLTRVAMVENMLRQHPHIKLHNAWRKQGGIPRLLQLELNNLLLGVAPERILTGSVRAKRLIVPERAICYRNSPLVIQRASAIMRGQLRHRQAVANARDACVVLVVDRSCRSNRGTTRPCKRGRVVQNHESLLGGVKRAATAAGRTCRSEVHSEGHPLAEQLQHFSRATLVVAPHGAALSLLLVCKRGTMVLELLNTHGWKVLCFAELAMMLSLSYRGIFVPGAHHNGPMHLSLSVLHQVEAIAQSWLRCGSEACRANVTVADLSLLSTNHTF